MKVSLITPTKMRETFLKQLLEMILNQTHTDWEWLIHDTTDQPLTQFVNHSDKRVRYISTKTDISIGAKRNTLIKEATGEYIFHFDDDDFYAPNYICFVLNLLKEGDFFSINSWFSYDTNSAQHFYFATNHPSQTHFILDGFSGSRIREIDFGPKKRKETIELAATQGYGFTFAYRRSITNKCSFLDLDIGEDRAFVAQVKKKGYKMISIADHLGIAVKMVHSTNISKVYPQYRLPSFVAKKQLPEFTTYLDRYEDRFSHSKQPL